MKLEFLQNFTAFLVRDLCGGSLTPSRGTILDHLRVTQSPEVKWKVIRGHPLSVIIVSFHDKKKDWK